MYFAHTWAFRITFCACLLIFLKKYLFVSLAASDLSFGTQALRCMMQDLLLRLTGPLVVARRLTCSAVCGISVPQPGIEPMFPALQGRVLPPGPQGKSLGMIFENVRGRVKFPLFLHLEIQLSHIFHYRSDEVPLS